MSKLNKPNMISSIIGIILSSFVFFMSRSFPKPPATLIGPRFFPMILSLALFGFSTALLVLTLLKKDKTEYEKIDVKSPEFKRSLYSLLASIVYVFAMQILGFITATVLYLLFLMYLLQNRRYLIMGTVSVGASIVVYFLFRTVLNITLPAGFLI